MDTKQAELVENALGTSLTGRLEQLMALSEGPVADLLTDYVKTAVKTSRDNCGDLLYAMEELTVQGQLAPADLAKVLRPAFDHIASDYRRGAEMLFKTTGETAPKSRWASIPDMGNLAYCLNAVGGRVLDTPRDFVGNDGKIVPWIARWIELPVGTFKESGYTFRFQVASNLFESVEGAPVPGAYVDFAYDEEKQVHLCLQVEESNQSPMVHVVDHECWHRGQLYEFSEFLHASKKVS